MPIGTSITYYYYDDYYYYYNYYKMYYLLSLRLLLLLLKLLDPWGCAATTTSSSLSAAMKVGLKSLFSMGWLPWCGMWLRLIIEFPFACLQEYILTPADNNPLNTGITLNGT